MYCQGMDDNYISPSVIQIQYHHHFPSNASVGESKGGGDITPGVWSDSVLNMSVVRLTV